MKKKIIIVTLVAMIASVLTISVLAATGAVQITASLDSGITIRHNGQAQNLTDANGAAVYPILYNGTTYLPVRAVAGLFGVPVDWDGNTRTVLLGATGKEVYLRDLKPSSSHDYSQVELIEDKFGGVYRNAIELNPGREAYVEYYLGKAYTTLTFTVAAAENFNVDSVISVSVLGDEKALYTSDNIDYKTKPIAITVDVSGQEYVRISVTGNQAYYRSSTTVIGNAKLS